MFLKCPEIDQIHFQFLSCFQSDNVPFFRWENGADGKMEHFKIFEHKEGLYEKKERDRFEIENKTKNKYDRFWGSSKTNKCHHVQNKSFTYFFRAFQVTSRFQINHLVSFNCFYACKSTVTPGIGDYATKFRVPTSFRQSLKL